MRFNEIIAELQRLTSKQRQILILRALELDDSTLSAADEKLVEARLLEHRIDPGSSMSISDLKDRLRCNRKF